MEKTVVNITGMSCEHCVSAVSGALSAIEGVKKVDVSLENKNAVVEHTSALNKDELVKAIEEQGFDASL